MKPLPKRDKPKVRIYQVWTIDNTWDGGRFLKGTFTNKKKAEVFLKSLYKDNHCYNKIQEL